jgi:uncharacterized membrane protein
MTTQLASRKATDGTDGAVRRGRVLGWASLGLGVVQVTAPNAVRRVSGVDDSPTSRAVVPLVGARELVHAAGLLTSRRIGPWAWTRVAGDAMDLTSLGLALARRTGQRRRRLLGVTGAVLGITALDVLTAVQATRTRTAGPMELTAAATIRKPASEVYGFWRRLEHLSTFMAHVDEVRTLDERRSHWRASAPFGRTVEWDAEIVEDVPGERIAWRSTGDADVPNTGKVWFKPAPDGVSTEVHVLLVYDIPGGTLGRAVAKYFGEEPRQQVDDDLRRLKQVLETGEVVRSDGAPWGKRARREFPQRPAQPLPAREREEVLRS